MDKDYNRNNIRILLTEGFTHEELHDFCFDEAAFRPVYDKLVPKTGKEDIIRLLLDHANRKLQIEVLLKWAKEHNPARYEKHQPYYSNITTSPAISKEAKKAELQSKIQSDETWERNTNDQETDFEVEIYSTDEVFTPRSIACYDSPTAPSALKPPDWEWEPKHFSEVVKKINSLKAMFPPFSEVRQRYNEIVAAGRKAELDFKIEDLGYSLWPGFDRG